MVSSYSFDVNITGAFLCPATVLCGAVKAKIKGALLDTGAGMCHMTFAMWCDLGFHKLCYDEKKDILNQQGINSPEEMTFDTLPFPPKTSRLGDNTEVTTYEFRLDELILGERTESSNPITLTNITVRIIDSDKLVFLVGLNVLRYLKIKYVPTPLSSICRLSFDSNGSQLLEQDRKTKGINNMQSMFKYIT